MNHKPDYKKSYFETRLNQSKVPIKSLLRSMQQFGYHYEYEDGRYYVYNDYEWKVKQKFDQTIKPMLSLLVEGFRNGNSV